MKQNAILVITSLLAIFSVILSARGLRSLRGVQPRQSNDSRTDGTIPAQATRRVDDAHASVT